MALKVSYMKKKSTVNTRVEKIWPQTKWRHLGRVEIKTSWRETKKTEIKLAAICNKNEQQDAKNNPEL